MKKSRELLELAIEAALIAGERTLKFYKHSMDVVVKDDHSPLTLADLEANLIITDMLSLTELPILSEEGKVTGFADRKAWELFWLVDPLDGTKEFINQSKEYTVNIALIQMGKPVLGVVFAPALDLLYFATRKNGSFKYLVKRNDSLNDILEKASELKSGKPHTKLKIVASRSHVSEETKDFIHKLGKVAETGEMHSYGSSLKLCMVAEGSADIYPRFGPTMEWDTAASHAVAEYAGCKVINAITGEPIVYNKEQLVNPGFIVFNSMLSAIVEKVIKK
jgi:3'(2'), 5'-bisphosphate nucleotidase